MRLLPVIAYGTERYPEKVARRLRAVNITAVLVALGMALFAIKRPDDPDKVTIATAACVALVPFLHRFGPTAAPIALMLLVYVQACRIIVTVGTGDGIILGFLMGPAISILLIGWERARLAAIMAFVSTAVALGLYMHVPYDTGDISAIALKVNFALNFVLTVTIVFCVVLYAVRQAARAEHAAEVERERSDALLANILPVDIAERLRGAPETTIADSHDQASVLFADMAGFTARAGAMSPQELVRFLNRVFSAFDRLVERHGLEKIKTTGDAYMVVAGVPAARADHAEALAALALDMRDAALGFEGGVPIRIGIACGPVVAGVVGTRKFFYDVWGDAVNVAARMESTGEPGRIQVSREAFARLERSFVLEPRGTVEVKGKGLMRTWYLIGRRPPPEV